MEIICDKNLCCGCEACKNICPKRAISMKEDIYGVKYPEIDQEKCINCGMCQKLCPQTNRIETNNVIECYAAKRKSQKKRLNSASGGIASCLYEAFLKEITNSVVFGVEFNDNNIAKFKMTKNFDDLEKFKGSKYVQADIDNLYVDIENCLKNRMNVLVVGTPCQIAGINSFLGKKRISKEKLYTIDLICHGVAPNKYLNENLEYLKKKYNWKNIKNISFRSNRTYRNFHFCLEAQKNKIKNYNRYSQEDPYFFAFLKGISLRENCYKCKYANTNRVADITLGDFIGIGKHKDYDEYNDDSKNNTSIVLVNTDKGQKLFEKILNDIDLKTRNIKEALIECTSLREPFPKSEYRQNFLDNYIKEGFVTAVQKIMKNDADRITLDKKILRPLKIKIANLLDKKIKK